MGNENRDKYKLVTWRSRMCSGIALEIDQSTAAKLANGPTSSPTIEYGK